MTRRRRLVSVAAGLLTFVGCSTIRNLTEAPELRHGVAEPPRAVYGGAKHAAREGLVATFSQERHPRPLVSLYFLGVDLPLSLVADTVTLPITIPASREESARTAHEDALVRQMLERARSQRDAANGAARLEPPAP